MGSPHYLAPSLLQDAPHAGRQRPLCWGVLRQKVSLDAAVAAAAAAVLTWLACHDDDDDTIAAASTIPMAARWAQFGAAAAAKLDARPP
jgi:hypothetical protein